MAKKSTAKTAKLAATGRLGSVLKNIKSPTYHIGFSTIDTWADTGNYAINRIMSGSFDKGLLFGRNYMLYGESGSGKSYKAAELCGLAQKQLQAAIVWMDIEKATDPDFLVKAGIDVEDPGFHFVQGGQLKDVYDVISGVCDDYRNQMAEGIELKPLIIMVDSWSALMTSGQVTQIKKKELTGDQGQLAKQTGEVVKRATHVCANLPILIIGVGHVYDSQEMYGPKHKTTGGHKLRYMASGCLILTKKYITTEDLQDPELKEMFQGLEAGQPATFMKDKRADAVGQIINVQVDKSRTYKPGASIKVEAVFDGPNDPYSGLMELMFKEGAFKKVGGAYYEYGSPKDPTKIYKKNFKEHAHKIMEWADEYKKIKYEVNDSGGNEEGLAEDGGEPSSKSA
jgi:RecA/RadA recombinase